MRVRGILLLVALLGTLAGLSPVSATPPVKPAPAGHWQRTADGVMVEPAAGFARRVRLIVMTDRILRVSEFPGDDLALPPSLAVVAKPSGAAFTAAKSGDVLTLKTARVTAHVSLRTGKVDITDAAGRPLLAETGTGVFAPTIVDGQKYFVIGQAFNAGTDEGFYGLGQHENRVFDYNGADVDLAQHNMDIAIPFVVSTRNYGVLWDNNGITRFGDPREYQPVSATLDVKGDGGAPGLTARYAVNGATVLTRQEADVNYQYIRDQARLPPSLWDAATNSMAKNLTVSWTGRLTSAVAGTHHFKLYVSSYAKLYIDGKPVIDAWRQNWNPWYRDFDVPMKVGVPVAIRIEWTPNDGYIRLLHQDPLPAVERHSLTLSSQTAHAIDYYVVSGANLDEVVAGYRALTGKAQMLPRWAYGYWQSRDHYETQDQLLDTVREYRKRGIPLDNIVQDWRYWPDPQWGSHRFDPARYPDPAGMVKAVHDMHAHIMISVWPKFYPSTTNYGELAAANGVYLGNIEDNARDWVGPGYPSTYYDPYSPKAADIYWRQIQDNLGVLGFDAWWLDNDEPDIRSNLSIADREHIMGPTAIGPAAEYFNTYPLVHAGGVYDRWLALHPDTRVFLFSRSGFAGIQRYATANWSGDLTARWSDLADQIPAGINYSLSGTPNWTFDIGGYVLEDRFIQNPTPQALDEWRELYLRWFQFGAFVPIFRSHGQGRLREIFSIADAGTPVYDSLVWYDKLRYRLMPYIYTLAADDYARDSTMMRGLPMDFPDDPKVKSLGDEYMFGPAFLVAPVTEYKARTRSVYLPAGTRWFDFYTGKAFAGGQRIEADAPLARMPLFVRAGAIVPLGPDIQYTAEKPDAAVTLDIYTGANGRFDLYEDDGVSYGYQRGQFTRIPITYDERTQTLTIGARQGDFAGAPKTRVFQLRWISGPRPNASDFDTPPDASVTYAGMPVSVKRGSSRT